MADDWYLAAVREVEESAERLHAAVDAAIDVLRVSVEARSGGANAVEVLRIINERGGRASRLAATEAFRDFEHASTVLRALIVRSLVDDHGMTLSDVANVMGVSRQMIGRLYRSVGTDQEST